MAYRESRSFSHLIFYLPRSKGLSSMMAEQEEIFLMPSNTDDGVNCECCTLEYDPSYFKTAEGAIRILSMVQAAVGMIFIVAAFFPTAGIFFLLVGLTFVSYSFVVIFLEVCIPNVFVHRIIDIVVLFVFSGLLLISALFNSYFGLKKREGHLCVAAISGLLCALTCIVMAILVFLKFRTHGNDRSLYL